MLQVHPDTVEAHQTGHFEGRRIGKMKCRDQRWLVTGKLGFNSARPHRLRSVRIRIISVSVFGMLQPPDVLRETNRSPAASN